MHAQLYYIVLISLISMSESLNKPLFIPTITVYNYEALLLYNILFYSCVGVVAQQLSKSCLLCLFDHVLVTSDSPCLTTPASDYEMTYGLMIISKKELKSQTVMPHNNQSQIRGILTASVRSP